MLLALSGGPAEDICLTHCPCFHSCALLSPSKRNAMHGNALGPCNGLGFPGEAKLSCHPPRGPSCWVSCKHLQPSSLLQGSVPQHCLFGEFMSPHSSWRSSMARLNPLAGSGAALTAAGPDVWLVFPRLALQVTAPTLHLPACSRHPVRGPVWPLKFTTISRRLAWRHGSSEPNPLSEPALAPVPAPSPGARCWAQTRSSSAARCHVCLGAARFALTKALHNPQPYI